MKTVLMVLAGIGAFVLLGAVVLPFLGWLLHTLAWVAAGVLVIGAGVFVARKVGGGAEHADELTTPRP